jgi:hypothetical protein
MPYAETSCKLMGHCHSRKGLIKNDVVYFIQHFYQFFKKPLSTSGSALACPSLCRLFVFKPDYAQDPDAHNTNTAVYAARSVARSPIQNS